MFEVLTSYRWPVLRLENANLDLRVRTLAERLGIKLQEWDEPGLGQATGFCVRTSSGRVFLIAELERSRGLAILTDAGDIAAFGIATLVNELITQLSLGDVKIAAIAPVEIEQLATELATKLEIANRSRTSDSQ